MSNKFLDSPTEYENIEAIVLDGTGDLNINSIQINSLLPSMPVFTDSNKVLISQEITLDNIDLKVDDPNRALESDGTNHIVSSATTSTELGYLSGTTSNIQTQLNSKGDIFNGGQLGFVAVGSTDNNDVELIQNNTPAVRLTSTNIELLGQAKSASFNYNELAPGAVSGSAGQLIVYADTSDNLRAVSNTSDEILATQTYINNLQSTGVLEGGLLTINADTTKYDISDGNGNIYDALTGTNTAVSWSGLTAQTTGQPYTGVITFIFIDSLGTVVAQGTKPTNTQIRDNIFLGVLVHVDNININTTNDEQMTLLNPVNQTRDLMEALGFINIEGNLLSSNSLLTIQKSFGKMLKFGSNFKNNIKDPHWLDLPLIDTNAGGIFQYRMRDGTSSALTLTNVISNIKDDGSPYPGTTYGNSRWGIHYVFSFTSNALKIQPTQDDFKTSDEAVASIGTGGFVIEPSIKANGLLIGYIVHKGNASDLSDPAQGFFISADKFGSGTSTAVGGTQSLQSVYDNSIDPEIITDATRQGVSIQIGSGLDTDDAFEVKNTSGTLTAFITGEGNLECNEVKTNSTTLNEIKIMKPDLVNQVGTLGTYNSNNRVYIDATTELKLESNGNQILIHNSNGIDITGDSVDLNSKTGNDVRLRYALNDRLVIGANDTEFKNKDVLISRTTQANNGTGVASFKTDGGAIIAKDCYVNQDFNVNGQTGIININDDSGTLIGTVDLYSFASSLKINAENKDLWLNAVEDIEIEAGVDIRMDGQQISVDSLAPAENILLKTAGTTQLEIDATEINLNLNTIANGTLTLNADPIANLEASTKQYVDAHNPFDQTLNVADDVVFNNVEPQQINLNDRWTVDSLANPLDVVSYNFALNTSTLKTWKHIAMSRNGQYQTAVADFIYRSNNYGKTWTQQGLSRNWTGCDVSRSGKYQVACASLDYLYKSTDYGITWVQTTQPASTKTWATCSIDETGQYISATGSNLKLFYSSDGGTTMTERNNTRNWRETVTSEDAQYYLTCVFNGKLYVSSTYGTGNAASVAPTTSKNWVCCAVDREQPLYQGAGEFGGSIWLATDGTTFVETTSGTHNWDQIKIVYPQVFAVTDAGLLITSQDYGVNWHTTTLSGAGYLAVSYAPGGIIKSIPTLTAGIHQQNNTEIVRIQGNVQYDGVIKRVNSITDLDSPYLAQGSEETILIDSSSGAISITLPDTGNLIGDRQITFKNTQNSVANPITINRSGGVDTIDGAVSKSLTLAYESLTLISDITNGAWFIV